MNLLDKPETAGFGFDVADDGVDLAANSRPEAVSVHGWTNDQVQVLSQEIECWQSQLVFENERFPGGASWPNNGLKSGPMLNAKARRVTAEYSWTSSGTPNLSGIRSEPFIQTLIAQISRKDAPNVA